MYVLSFRTVVRFSTAPSSFCTNSLAHTASNVSRDGVTKKWFNSSMAAAVIT